MSGSGKRAMSGYGPDPSTGAAVQHLPAEPVDPSPCGQGLTCRVRGTLLLGHGDLRPSLLHPHQSGKSPRPAALSDRHVAVCEKAGKEPLPERGVDRGGRSMDRRPQPYFLPEPPNTTSTRTSPMRSTSTSTSPKITPSWMRAVWKTSSRRPASTLTWVRSMNRESSASSTR